MTLDSIPDNSSCARDSAMKQPLTSFPADGKNGVRVRTCKAEAEDAFPVGAADSFLSLSACAMIGFKVAFRSFQDRPSPIIRFDGHFFSPRRIRR